MSVSENELPSEGVVTIFSRLPNQFPKTGQNGTEKIKTREFLDASTGVVTLVEKFGKVFAPVVYDINGNIKKINAKYVENEKEYEFLEDMILKQRDAGDMQAVEALMWLRRALHFITRFFQYVIEDTDSNNNSHDLSPFIKSAYKETLERYHGWLGIQLFNILSKFIPKRQQLFYHLALDCYNRDEQVLHDMKVFTGRMSNCVQKLVEFYHTHDLETNDRV